MSTEVSKEMNPTHDEFAAMLAESLAKDDLAEGEVVACR
jgi:small subunit ribosomal protein S1